MHIYEEEFQIPIKPGHTDLIPYLREAVAEHLQGNLLPVRFTITRTDDKHYQCELGVITGVIESTLKHTCSIFDYQQRRYANDRSFNAVMLVPTGIGCEIGGHAGDANPAARLLASACDTLITHPNVVNASDINELPDNGLYVEGSIISRLLMGTVGLQPVRSNRVLAVIDKHTDALFTDAAINSINAARATLGLSCPHVVVLDPSVSLKSMYASSGRAVGRVEQLTGLLEVLEEYKGEYDALALSTQIQVPIEYHTEYYEQRGAMINPWGGVEAIFTHALSSLYDIPAAHSPMLESREVSNISYGVVDSRMSAEVISEAFFICVLKGLQRAPRIIKDIKFDSLTNVLTAADVGCLVLPDGCIGLPTLAALAQNIPVIAVRENRNIMQNDLTSLPWRDGQLTIVDNYWEAAGVMSALRAGVDPAAVRRPLPEVDTVHKTWS